MRKARLRAQRDLLKDHKKKQMVKELTEFNEKTQSKQNLFDELKKIDDSQPELVSNEEMEKRRKVFKVVR